MPWSIWLMVYMAYSCCYSGVKSAFIEHKQELIGPTICKTLPGLSKEQTEICHQYPDVTSTAMDGLQLAIEECQYQFQWHRWNCSSLSTKNKNPHSNVLLQRGYRETAFAYAISAAGVAHSVARACSSGKLIACGCDPSSYRQRGHSLKEKLLRDNKRPKNSKSSKYTDLSEDEAKKLAKRKSANRWKWGGCSHNLDFGVEFSQSFLDLREKAGDLQSRINLHNNEAGRLAVATNVQVRCKCHGYSGSCELKTCWKAAPDFRLVGEVLKERFRSAILVDQSNTGSGSLLLDPPKKHRRRPKSKPFKKQRRKRKRRPDDLALELFYYQRSPNFCERDLSVDFPGTTGRQCNKTSRGLDSCSSMCCGRGYNRMRERRTERQCTFKWCCEVICQNFTTEGWITVCK